MNQGFIEFYSREILQEQRQLATTVLDALSNLNLGADLLAEVKYRFRLNSG